MYRKLGSLFVALAGAAAAFAVPDTSVAARGFQENRGQYEPAVRYAWHGPQYTLLLAEGWAALTPHTPGECNGLRMRWPGSKPRRPRASGELGHRTHFLLGNDPQLWRTGVAAFRQVEYRDIYPGIDLVFRETAQGVEYDFIVRRGAKPEAVRIAAGGGRTPASLDPSGDVKAPVCSGEFRMHKPVLYQTAGTARRQISGGFVRDSDGAFSFRVGAYDRSRTLVIDPVITWSTYMGGSGESAAKAIATDPQGSIYIAGSTTAANFSGSSRSRGLRDVFLSKLSPDGSRILYTTVIGGTGMDWANALQVGPDGSVYIAGETDSTDFPAVSAARGSRAGMTDAFLTKVAADGASILFSTYLGGADVDAASAIAVNSRNEVWVAGTTSSAEFPTTGAFQQSFGGGARDAFVAQFSGSGSLMFSSFAGGGEADEFSAITLDGSDNVYLAGWTWSSNFPTSGAFQARPASVAVRDGIVMKLNGSARSVVWATYLGGTGDDAPLAIAVDSGANVYVGGETWSEDFPRAGPLQAVKAGASDAFLVRIAADGRTLLASTYLGGAGADSIRGLLIGDGGVVYATGSTGSTDFPVVETLKSPDGSGDAFVAALTPALTSLRMSTVFGGSVRDMAWGLRLLPGGSVAVAGVTASQDFPSSRALQGNRQGATDAFVLVVGQTLPSPDDVVAVSAASLSGLRIAPGSVVSLFGSGLATSPATAQTTTLPTSIQGVTVRLTASGGSSSDVPLYYVSPGQINFVVPPATPAGPATITVNAPGGRTFTTRIHIGQVAPALFSAAASGQGVAAAVVTRIRGGEPSFELPFRCTDGNCVPLPIDLGPASEDVYLTLYGTGIRQRESNDTVVVRMGNVVLPVLFAGPQPQYPGLDQVNFRLPRNLAGAGLLPVSVLVDNILTNRVLIQIR